MALGLANCGGGGGGSSATTDPNAFINSALVQYGIDREGMGGDPGGDTGAAGGAGDGAPLKQVVVTLTDSQGNQQAATTDANGKFLIRYKASAMVPPLVARVISASGNTLTAFSVDANSVGSVQTININPLTDKITSDVLASGIAGTDKAFDGSHIETSKVNKAKQDLLASVQAALSSVGVANVSNFDAIKSRYAYDGTQVDAVLESIAHARDATTGATQLRVKASGITTNPDGTVNLNGGVLVTATTPLSTSAVIQPTDPGLTFGKLNAWVNELNRCLALDAATRNTSQCFAANYLVSGTFRQNSADFFENYKTLFSEPSAYNNPVQGSTFRNPVVLYVGNYPGSTSSNPDMAVVEVTIRQPYEGANGPDGAINGVIEYPGALIFKRDDSLTGAVASNWILHGNQRNYSLSANTRITRTEQLNPARNINSTGNSPGFLQVGLRTHVVNSQFNSSTRSWSSANIRAVRVTGPALPPAGLVMVPTTAATLQGAMGIYNKTGAIPTTAVTTSNGNEFKLAAVTLDSSALYDGWANFNNPWWNSNGMLTDFSSLQAYTQYKFEVFLNSNTTIGSTNVPDTVEYSRIQAAVNSPTAYLKLPVNDAKSLNTSLLSPGAAAVASGGSVNVGWVNNLNAATVNAVFAYGYECIPKNCASATGSNISDNMAYVSSAYSVASRPSSASVTVSPTLPAIGATSADGPRDFRYVTLRSWQGRAFLYSSALWTN